MDITVQMGHNPPRTERPGETGTYRELEWNGLAGPVLRDALTGNGHSVTLIGSDATAGAGDLFISLHLDSGNATVNGPGQATNRQASVGYPISPSQAPQVVLNASAVIGAEWRNKHSAIYPGGWHDNNFTPSLSNYYMWSDLPGHAGGGRYGAMYLAEHFVGPNSLDEEWGFANITAITQAHVDAIGAVYGHPGETIVTTFGNASHEPVYSDGDVLVLNNVIGSTGDNFHQKNLSTGATAATRFGRSGDTFAGCTRVGDDLIISVRRGNQTYFIKHWPLI